jgi:hypothetical protein
MHIPESDDFSPSRLNNFRDYFPTPRGGSAHQPLSPGDFEFYRKLTRNPLYPSKKDLQKVAQNLMQKGRWQ